MSTTVAAPAAVQLVEGNGTALPFPSTPSPVIAAAIARGEARAAADVATGIADLTHQLATAEEWKASSKMDGARRIIPERALLAGMLGHLTNT